MKRGIMMSLALIAILSSILYLSMEMRSMADDVLNYRDTSINHLYFTKTVLTGHNIWAKQVADEILSDVLDPAGLSTCGVVNTYPVLFQQSLCSLQPSPIEYTLADPMVYLCEDGKVGTKAEWVYVDGPGHGSTEQVVTDISCKRISTSLPGSLQGIMHYNISAHSISVPIDFDIDTSFISSLNTNLSEAFDFCKPTFNIYSCLEQKLDVCGYDASQVCIVLGNIEQTFYVNESNLPTTMEIGQDTIKVRNPVPTFNITVFDSEIKVAPSLVAASESFQSKIVTSTGYSISNLNCDSSITYCNGILTIPKTEDHVYVQFDEDKYYTFKQ